LTTPEALEGMLVSAKVDQRRLVEGAGLAELNEAGQRLRAAQAFSGLPKRTWRDRCGALCSPLLHFAKIEYYWIKRIDRVMRRLVPSRNAHP
jgi:hypothetical protein